MVSVSWFLVRSSFCMEITCSLSLCQSWQVELLQCADRLQMPTTVQWTNDRWLDIVSCVKGNRNAIAVLTSAMHIWLMSHQSKWLDQWFVLLFREPSWPSRIYIREKGKVPWQRSRVWPFQDTIYMACDALQRTNEHLRSPCKKHNHPETLMHRSWKPSLECSEKAKDNIKETSRSNTRTMSFSYVSTRMQKMSIRLFAKQEAQTSKDRDPSFLEAFRRML